MCLAEGACQGMEPARQAHPAVRAGSDSNDGGEACQGSSSATIVSVMIMKAPAPCRERITSPTLRCRPEMVTRPLQSLFADCNSARLTKWIAGISEISVNAALDCHSDPPV